MSPILSLSWLADFIDALPKHKKRRKNIYEIAGFPRWENVNSNVLAFYLRENEQHGFQRLFLESLIEIALKKEGWKADQRFDISGEAYEVLREVGTVDQKRIDILVQPRPSPMVVQNEGEEPTMEATADWAIVIENKIDADLYNHLHIYADHTKASRKLLIVLSVHAIGDAMEVAKMKTFGFINIRHQELIETVRSRLPAYMDEADDRHLLFLKDYFSSIQQLYEDPMAAQESEATLALFHKYNKEIWRMEHESAKLMTYVTESTIEGMKMLGYFCDSKNTAIGKHFRKMSSKDPDNEHKFLRFWIWLDGLRLYGDLHAVYEVYGDTKTGIGVMARKALQDRYGKILQTGDVRGVTFGQKGGAGSQYCQLFRLQLQLREADGNLSQRIQMALQRDFIDPGYFQAANDAFFRAKNPQ